MRSGYAFPKIALIKSIPQHKTIYVCYMLRMFSLSIENTIENLRVSYEGDHMTQIVLTYIYSIHSTLLIVTHISEVSYIHIPTRGKTETYVAMY